MKSCDIAIVGGGPGGSTVASFVKKHMPALDVVIIEKERFPRDHVGESQLPPVSKVLHEMGAWEKVESAGFPIKIGASYTWGKSKEPWMFGFIPVSEVGSLERPGTYEGWRQRVAFQVDRAVYDDILLNHARSLGVCVLQPSRIVNVDIDPNGGGHRIDKLRFDDGSEIKARYYVDASGNAAIIRRQLGIEVDAPSLLRNVAFWNYWSAPNLNTGLLEQGTSRVLIRSLSFGWLWYIAVSNDRASVGLVCNAEYYKSSGETPEQLYQRALGDVPVTAGIHERATCNAKLSATTDWSYIATRAYGENWFLVGESLGFADPILAAGLTLTHTCAQHCAYTILDLERGQKDRNWLLDQYHDTQTRRIRQHMKFAEYWYSANGLFSDILDNCSSIAAQSGLQLEPQDAFRWLSHGGIDDIPGQFAIGGLGLAGIKSVQKRFQHTEASGVAYLIDGMNTFNLDLSNAVQDSMALPLDGEVKIVPVLRRGTARLPLTGSYVQIFTVLQSNQLIEHIIPALQQSILASDVQAQDRSAAFTIALQCLESMVGQGWVKASHTAGHPSLSLTTPEEGDIVYTESLGPRTRI